MSKLTSEQINTLSEKLRKVGNEFTGIVGKEDASAEQKLMAIRIGLATSSAADTIDHLHESEAQMRSAIEAALASLEGIPGTHDVSAVLAAALPGDAP